MTGDRVTDAVKDLREPYRLLVSRHRVMGGRGLDGLSCLIVGAPVSGKTTEANRYAEALVKAGLVGNREPVVVTGAASPEELRARFKSAENGVIIIDNIYDLSRMRGDQVNDVLTEAFDTGKCAIILTGDKDEMEAYFDQCRRDLRARMPQTITTDPSGLPPEALQRMNVVIERNKKALIAHSNEEWRQMAEDVTLRKPVRRMNSLTLVRRKKSGDPA